MRSGRFDMLESARQLSQSLAQRREGKCDEHAAGAAAAQSRVARSAVPQQRRIDQKGRHPMGRPAGKAFVLTVIVLSVLVPIAVLFWNPQVGVAVFVLGSAIAFRCLRLLRTLNLEATIQDLEMQPRPQNHAHTIVVPLVDADGHDLPADIAEATLVAARLQAGPREVVIGVRRHGP
jgi:hypothetical protein